MDLRAVNSNVPAFVKGTGGATLGTSRKSGVRRRNGRCGGGFGGGGSGGGDASAAAKTRGLGYNERPTTALETARREAMFEFRSRWDLNTTWGHGDPLELHRRESRFSR